MFLEKNWCSVSLIRSPAICLVYTIIISCKKLLHCVNNSVWIIPNMCLIYTHFFTVLFRRIHPVNLPFNPYWNASHCLTSLDFRKYRMSFSSPHNEFAPLPTDRFVPGRPLCLFVNTCWWHARCLLLIHWNIQYNLFDTIKKILKWVLINCTLSL